MNSAWIPVIKRFRDLCGGVVLSGRNRVADSLLSPAAYLMYPIPDIALLTVVGIVLFTVLDLIESLLVRR